MENVCAVILAAGKGKRMNSQDSNKVSLEIKGKPIIVRNIEILKNSGIADIVVVVGFAKDSILQFLDKTILTVEQSEALGTGHATKTALSIIPKKDEYVLVVYGDDAFWFTPQILNNLYKKSIENNADLIFCTTFVESPEGLGRIIRDNNKVVDIVEEKNTTDLQKQIKEVNIGGYLFKKDFLIKNIDLVEKNEVSGEYYLTDLINIASKKGKNIQTLTLENFVWRGINTPEHLQEAEKLLN